MPELTQLEELVDRYLSAWNEEDVTTRRALIADTYADDATYRDPLLAGEGRDGINAMIAGLQSQYPGLKFRRTGKVDSHDSHARFGWEIAPPGGPAVAGGVDFVTVRAGLLQSVVGFFDFAPGQQG